MTTLLLARHGETDWNREHRWQGHADQPLNEAGRAQARELAEALAGRSIDAIYTSDLARAHETATIIAERLGLALATNELLREVDVGDWAGRLVSDLEVEDPTAIERWKNGVKAWNGGESYEEMAERIVAVVLDLAASHPGAILLIVTHGGSIRACRASAAGVGYHASKSAGIGSLANCEVVELHFRDDRLTPVIR